MLSIRQQTRKAEGFATSLQLDTELGLAMLLAEDDDGNTQPVDIASSLREALDLAASDMRQRARRLELGEDAGLCPARYTLWARGIDGKYNLEATLDN